MATVIYAAFFVVAANALVDIVYAWLDPRVGPHDAAPRSARSEGLVPHRERPRARGRRRVVHARGRARLGIVGESGSGKSVTALSIMQLLRDPNAIFAGQVLYKGRDLMALSQKRDAQASAAPRSR